MPSRSLATMAAMLGWSLSLQAASKTVEVVSDWVRPLRTESTSIAIPRETTKPIVFGDIVFAASLAGEAIALHRLDSYLFWRAKLPAGVEAAFNQGRSRLVVGDQEGNLIALNTRDGSLGWKIHRPVQWLSPPEIVKGKILVTSSADEVLALNENNGDVLWEMNGRGDEKMTIRGTSSPTVFHNDVFVGFSTGKVASLSLDDGSIRWEKRVQNSLSRQPQRRFYDVDMKPYVDQRSVIVGNYEGNTISLKRENGDAEWIFPVGSFGGYLVESDRVYFAGTNGSFYALDRESGQPVWSVKFDGGVASAPARVGEYLVFTVSSDPMYVLEAKTGQVAGTYRLGAGSLAAPVTSGQDTFYCLSNYGNLYGFRLRKINPMGLAAETVPTLSALNRFGQFGSDTQFP